MEGGDEHKREGHDHGNCDHCKNENLGEMQSLWKNIDIDRVSCLNESVHESAKKIFRPWGKRLETQPYVESDADEELIFFIPFCGLAKLKSICVIGGTMGSSPSKLKLYINKENMDFDTVNDMKPVQEIDLAENFAGIIEYPLQAYKWGDVYSVSIYIPQNWGADKTVVTFIGFKGSCEELRKGIVITNYELRPTPEKNQGIGGMANQNNVF